MNRVVKAVDMTKVNLQLFVKAIMNAVATVEQACTAIPRVSDKPLFV